MSVCSRIAGDLFEGREQLLCSSAAPGSAGSKSACTWSMQQREANGGEVDSLCSNGDEDFLIGTQVADGGSVECYQLFDDGMVSTSGQPMGCSAVLLKHAQLMMFNCFK